MILSDESSPQISGTTVIAKVGETQITYQTFLQQLEKKYGVQLMNQLIDREVIRQESQALGITVSQEEIDRELIRMQEGYENAEQFYKTMNDQLGLSKEAVIEEVHYNLQLERIATHQIHISDEQVQAYIQSNPEEFRQYESYHLLKIEVSNNEQAQQVIQDLKNGAVFEQLAKERSVDQATAVNGGDMGWIEGNDPFLPKEILDKAIELRIEEWSQPIVLPNKVVIIKLIERKDINDQDRKQIEISVRRDLALSQAGSLKEVLAKLKEQREVQILEPKFK